MTLQQGNSDVIKYEVRSTKYEVFKVRRNGVARGKVEEAKRERCVGTKSMRPWVEASLVRRASVTRMETSVAAIFRIFLGSDAHFVPRTSYGWFWLAFCA